MRAFNKATEATWTGYFWLLTCMPVQSGSILRSNTVHLLVVLMDHMFALRLPLAPPDTQPLAPPDTQPMRDALGEVQSRIVADDAAANSDGHAAVPPPPDRDGGSGVTATRARLSLKANAHVRITHLSPLSDLCKPNISSIRGNDLGRLIQIQVRSSGGWASRSRSWGLVGRRVVHRPWPWFDKMVETYLTFKP